MANEKRLIDANVVRHKINAFAAKVVYRGNAEMFTGKDTCNPHEYTRGYEKGVLDATNIVMGEEPVDAVEVADMKEFAEDVVYQFGYYCQNGGRLHITHGGLSTLEWAFDILGWKNPHPVPECECQIEGCHEHATCGTPTADGYKRVCGKHFARMDGDGNA